MGEDGTSATTTSLQLDTCFVCDFRSVEWKLMCRTPSCQKYRGKLYLCEKCVEHCPMCKCSLHPTDLCTVRGLLTLETYSSLQGQEEGKGQEPKMPKGKGKDGKGHPKGSGKGGARKGVGNVWRQLGAERAGHERTILVPGYAIGTVIGQSGSQLESFKSSYPQVIISIVKKEVEDTFAGRRAHQMELSLKGPAEQVDQLARSIQMLYDRAGPSHKPPTFETTLIRAFSPFAAKLTPADLEAFHVCAKQFLQTVAGGKARQFFALEKVPDAKLYTGAEQSMYTWCSDCRDWTAVREEFQKFLHATPSEKLSDIRLSVRLGKLFFWGPKLRQAASQMPGAISQLSFKDCRPQWAARLKLAVEKKLSDILRKSTFERLQELQILTFFLKTEEDGEKMEVTFYDPERAFEKASEITRIWACTSHREVLEIAPSQEASKTRVDMARRRLERLLHPLHNEFEGCWCAMQVPSVASEDSAGFAGAKVNSLQAFVVRRASERLFRGDVCRLGNCPDFRISITTSTKLDSERELILALKTLDRTCRSLLSRGEKLIDTFRQTSLPLGWKLQCIACRDECIWMDPDDIVEVNVSKVCEVTCLSTEHWQSDSENYEMRFSSEQANKAIRGRHENAWDPTAQLVATVQMLNDML
eukprot:Skav201806  [mRNA]  locus=scaffold1071:101986:106673:+ [translate_table: standard]